MPAMPRQSTSRCASRNSAGSRFVASPITSRLRTHARRRASSARKLARSTVAADPIRKSTSSRTCRSTASIEGDIDRLFEDQRAQVRAQPLAGEQLYGPARDLLEQLREVEERVVRLAACREADEHIEVALGSGFIACERAEDAQVGDAELSQPRTFGGEHLQDLRLCRHAFHELILAVKHGGSAVKSAREPNAAADPLECLRWKSIVTPGGSAG